MTGLPISSNISRQRTTQSRQIATPGPATPSSGRPIDFPQNEHRKERSGASSPARWGRGTCSEGIGSSLRPAPPPQLIEFEKRTDLCR